MHCPLLYLLHLLPEIWNIGKICLLLASGLFRGGHPLGIRQLALGNGSRIKRASRILQDMYERQYSLCYSSVKYK